MSSPEGLILIEGILLLIFWLGVILIASTYRKDK